MDPRLNRWDGYLDFHHQMLETGDCDPQYPAMRYIADRFELNREQRYWLAYLFSTCYSLPTAYYILNEFPDYENVSVTRLSNWWYKNKNRCLFQTDRAKVKNFDQLVTMFQSYEEMMGGSQQSAYAEHLQPTEAETYDGVYEWLTDLYYYGRFSLFLLLESVYELTGFPMQPTDLFLREAHTCREGLCHALNVDWKIGTTIKATDMTELQRTMPRLLESAQQKYPMQRHTFWNLETSLCAYRKLWKESRYLGYYIDRQHEEIWWMQEHVREGVNWLPLWNFRKEYFHPALLGELKGWKGIRKDRTSLFYRTGRFTEFDVSRPHKEDNWFPEAKNAYC